MGVYWATVHTAYQDVLTRSQQPGGVDAGEVTRASEAWMQAAIATWSLLGASAALGAGTGLMALFVDWWGYGDPLAEDGVR